MGFWDDVNAWAEERNQAFENGEEPTLGESLLILGGAALAIGTTVSVLNDLSQKSDTPNSAALVTQPKKPLKLAKKVKKTTSAILDIVAALNGMDRKNYKQYISTKIQLDAQIALEDVKTSNEIAKVKAESEQELEKIRLEAVTEIAKLDGHFERMAAEKQLDTVLGILRQGFDAEVRNREADLNQEREQRKKDQELKREQDEALWDRDRQTEYINRKTFQLNHDLTNLRKRYSELLKERDKLEETKSDKPSWIKEAAALDAEIETVEEQMSGLRNQLRQGNNG